jgi:hypothetical protein
MDEGLEKVFNLYGLERMGGASGRGWSYYSSIQKCLYYYFMNYKKKDSGTPSHALELGSCIHTMLALYYEGLRDPETRIDPERLKNELLELNVSSEIVLEAWRLFQAYESRYDTDYLTPLGAEIFAEAPDGTTCRYDLIAKVEDEGGEVVVPPGTWVVEHKSASRFDASMLEGWKNDGEIIGQIRIYQKAKLAKKYGKLQGVIVNLIGKHKQPQFQRVMIPVSNKRLKRHESDLKSWDMIRNICETTNHWPRSRASCVGRWGLCRYFDHCAER